MVMKEGCHRGDFEMKKNKKNCLMRFLGDFFAFGVLFCYFVLHELNLYTVSIYQNSTHPNLCSISIPSHTGPIDEELLLPSTFFHILFFL
jgi:hypothetical protein